MSLRVSFLLTIRTLPRSTLFPYTTLFRSLGGGGHRHYVQPAAPGPAGALPVRRAGDPQRRVPAAGALRRPARAGRGQRQLGRSEEHTSELQSLAYLVCRLLLEKKKIGNKS